MSPTIVGVLLLTLHIICCILIYLGIRTRILKVEKCMMPMVLFVPIWGPLCVLVLHFQLLGRRHSREIGLEKMRIKEEIYRSIIMENTETAKNVVPLEDALLLNVPGLRRELIMDMLNDNPEEYIELLHQARMNEDVEVVHYATTAMAELLKEYDFRLQKLEQDYAAHPEDEKALDKYCEFLRMYIEQGMVQGQMESVQRNQYSQLLSRKLEQKKELEPCICLMDNYLKMEEYTKAWDLLKMMEQYWPEREEYWMMKIRYYAQQKRGRELTRLIREMGERRIYLSAESRQTLAFWKQYEERAEG